jgi:GTP-binding protein Era
MLLERTADEGEYIDKIKESGIPVIIAINKVDLTNQADLEKIVEPWHVAFPDSPVIPVSGLKKFNLDSLLNAILAKFPKVRPYFPKDQLN